MSNITRKDFIKMCSLLGISLPLMSVAGTNKLFNTKHFKGKVIIIGAGVGGMSSGYLLNQMGVDFEILEASSFYGGRIKDNKTFADFPLPLGAEWIETEQEIFKEIVNDNSKHINIETFKDKPDLKFLNYSWLSFYEDYILPSISDKISYNTIVNSIDYSDNIIAINTQNKIFKADKVIIAVPLKILQDRDITFLPELPKNKINAINNIKIWSGFKAFFEFSDNFFEDDVSFKINPKTDGEKLYYDATYGQNSSKNILGLFVVGKPAEEYTLLPDEDIKPHILKELDNLFDGQASKKYINHVIQNWDKEPFIKSGYISDYTDYHLVKTLGQSINDKIYFAGGAYTDGEDWVSVHAAARSGKNAVKKILT